MYIVIWAYCLFLYSFSKPPFEPDIAIPTSPTKYENESQLITPAPPSYVPFSLIGYWENDFLQVENQDWLLGEPIQRWKDIKPTTYLRTLSPNDFNQILSLPLIVQGNVKQFSSNNQFDRKKRCLYVKFFLLLSVIILFCDVKTDTASFTVSILLIRS